MCKLGTKNFQIIFLRWGGGSRKTILKKNLMESNSWVVFISHSTYGLDPHSLGAC